MNVIDTLLKVHRIAEAYGASLDFRSAKMPVTLTVPYAGLQTGEVVRSMAEELLNIAGVMAETSGQKLTFSLDV